MAKLSITFNNPSTLTTEITIKDAVLTDIISTFDGATDAEKLLAFARFCRSDGKDRVLQMQTRELNEAANADLRVKLEALTAKLAE